MATITKIEFVLIGGFTVPVTTSDGSPLSITNGAADVTVSSLADLTTTIASFNKAVLSHWTTDLVNA